MTRSSYCLVVMSKAPIAGRVKTRLIPVLGARRAAGIYRCLLVETLEAISPLRQIDIRLSCAPDIYHASFLRAARQYGYRRQQQPTGDLGRRMSVTIAALLRHYAGVILIGADCPAMNATLIEQCRSYLEQGADLVLGSTDDGGYALIGMRRANPALFRGMPWGTARVAGITRQRAKRLGLRCEEVSGLWDVDTMADYRRWQRYRRVYGKDWGKSQGKAWVV